MIGPLNPVASKLGQEYEWKRTAATQNLEVTGNNDNREKYSTIINSECLAPCTALLSLPQKLCIPIWIFSITVSDIFKIAL